MQPVGSNWSHLQEFARRFSLAENAAQPEIRALFEPSIEFAACLIDMVGELDARWEHINGFDRQNARDNLMRAAQHILEAVIAALAGMYASANVIYRLSVESVLQSTYSDEEMLDRLGPGRRDTIVQNDWDLGASDYRRVLLQTSSLRHPANRLYTIYRSLSKVAHGDLKLFASLDQHLHALPRYFPKEAHDLQALMREGNAAAGVLIRKHFRSLFTAANLERVANFDETVRKLQPGSV